MDNLERNQHLVEAKHEYTNTLCDALAIPIYEGVRSVYEDVEKKCKPVDRIVEFQRNISKVHQWNKNIIEAETGRIMSRCSHDKDYLSNLLTGLMVVNTKILAVVKLNNTVSSRIDLKVPATDVFLHNCYIECSREFRMDPYLMDLSLPGKEQLANMRKAIDIIRKCIVTAIRKMTPISDITRHHIQNSVENGEVKSSLLTSDLSEMKGGEEKKEDKSDDELDSEDDLDSEDEKENEEEESDDEDEKSDDEEGKKSESSELKDENKNESDKTNKEPKSSDDVAKTDEKKTDEEKTKEKISEANDTDSDSELDDDEELVLDEENTSSMKLVDDDDDKEDTKETTESTNKSDSKSTNESTTGQVSKSNSDTPIVNKLSKTNDVEIKNEATSPTPQANTSPSATIPDFKLLTTQKHRNTLKPKLFLDDDISDTDDIDEDELEEEEEYEEIE